MAIEIKQLLIKSNIVQRTGNEDLDLSEEHRLLKEDVLEECRRMIADLLRGQWLDHSGRRRGLTGRRLRRCSIRSALQIKKSTVQRN
ncbi:MAG: hypothetical protein EBU46_07080 [Nitrosomonadaceae bacterium]|nr:hypothetical protein [Nitrosomonadaceae bacterium]